MTTQEASRRWWAYGVYGVLVLVSTALVMEVGWSRNPDEAHWLDFFLWPRGMLALFFCIGCLHVDPSPSLFLAFWVGSHLLFWLGAPLLILAVVRRWGRINEPWRPPE